jgi:hypothetical protein
MGRTAFARTMVAAMVLVAASACVGTAPTAHPSQPVSGPATYDPCAVPSDAPPEKARLIEQACRPNTLPPLVGTPIPWLDAPYTGPQITPSPTVDLESTYPKCEVAQVELTFEGWSPDDLGAIGWIVARTDGSKPCILSGLAQLVLVDGSGNALASGNEGDGPLGPALLRPGLPVPSAAPSPGPFGPRLTPGYGYEQFRVAGFCGSTSPAAAVAVSLPGRSAVTLSIPPLPESRCASTMGDVLQDWPFLSVDAPQPTVLPASGLEAIPVLPVQAVVGQPMEFTIALKDYHAVPVSLVPCPVYTLRMMVLDPNGQEASTIEREYTLNCGTITSIEPDQSIAFQMRFTVPAGDPTADSIVLWWWLGTSDNPTAPPTVKQPIQLVAP